VCWFIFGAIIRILLSLYVFLTWVLLSLVAAVVVPFCILVAGCSKDRTSSQVARICNYYYGLIWTYVCGAFFSVQYEQEPERAFPSPCIFTANHNSMLDLFYITKQPCKDFALATRSWPYRLVWFRWFMRKAEYIDMESQSWEKSLDMAKALLAKGTSIFIFPEGTRKHIEPMGRFHSGAFHLSMQTGVPIVPCCIWGTRNILPPKCYMPHLGNIKIKTLPAIYPDDFKQDKAAHLKLKKLVKMRMIKTLNEISTEHFTIVSIESKKVGL
jgi:1-acyl-sn-glycerol-3-phosphate acyltransferase